MYNIEEQEPTSAAEIACREELLVHAKTAAEEYGLEMELCTAWEESEPQERVQRIFFNTSTDSVPWCVGAIVRKNDGELRLWPRDSERGPIQVSRVITPKQLDDSVLEMVEQFTAA